MATGTQDGEVSRCAGALRVEASFGDESGVTRRRGSRGCSTAGSARRLRAGFRSMRCSGWSRNTVPAAFVERRTPRRSARAVADEIDQLAALAACGIRSLPRRSGASEPDIERAAGAPLSLLASVGQVAATAGGPVHGAALQGKSSNSSSPITTSSIGCLRRQAPIELRRLSA